ncbi:uncharacterized protein LOC132098216 [Carassius carassius]|uniref:uncharacterized protein LOC132098216 n=1 Tax=Carassius carassius TaxID=217509 RepID=UPI0028696E54|nr:uncharacterized protein LOC132098216 [Carassius carassius]
MDETPEAFILHQIGHRLILCRGLKCLSMESQLSPHRAYSERAHSPAPSYMSLSSDWSMDLPTNFKSGEAILLDLRHISLILLSQIFILSESKKRICELPTMKQDHVEMLHLSKEPSDEHKNIRVKSVRAASPAPSYMSLKTDLSMDPPTNFKDFLLDTRVRSGRAPSPTVSQWSDSSDEPPVNCKAEDNFPLDSSYCKICWYSGNYFDFVTSRLRTSRHFKCPLCKSMLKDPVSISCGHNYCRGCINEFWDNRAGVYGCPQCGNPSETRPVLNTNAALDEVVKSLQQAGFSPVLPPQSYAGPEDVACDYCTEEKLKAVKCCLTCVMSLCETHVKPHYTIAALQKHTLSDVTGDMKTGPSEQHQNTDNSFSSTGQQDQTDKTQDIIEEEIRSILDSVFNTCTSETEVSKDETNVSKLALFCSEQQDDSGHKSLSKLNENDTKKEIFNMEEIYFGDNYNENDFGVKNYEVDLGEYSPLDVEVDYDDWECYNYEGGIIDDYDDDIPDGGNYYDDYDDYY